MEKAMYLRGVESIGRKDKGHAVQTWTSYRVYVSFHVLSVAQK